MLETPSAAPPPLGARLSLWVRDDLRLPLLRNGYALILNSALTSLIGVGYWILAAHKYSPHDVGLDSAALSAMMFLAGVSQLNLMSALVRFIPRAGRQTRRLVQRSYLLSMGVAAVVATIFLLGVDHWAPRLGFLAASPGAAVGFVLATIAWCLFVLQDGVLTGLRRSGFVPIENAAFGLSKVVLLFVFAAAVPRHGVLASWTIALVVALVPTNLLIFGRLIPRHEATAGAPPEELSVPGMVRFVAADYVGFLFWLAPTTLVPVIVTQVAGASANAYFSLTWIVAYTLYLFSAGLGSSLVAEVAASPELVGPLSRKAVLRSMAVVVPAAACLFVAAPVVLGVFGDSYARGGSTLLRLLALSAIPNCANALAVSVGRAQRRMTAVVSLLALLCSFVVVLSLALLPITGVTGVGWAWLISQTVVAIVLARPLLRSAWLPKAGVTSLPRGAQSTLWIARRTGLLPAASWLRALPDMHHRRSEMSQAVPSILAALANDSVAPARDWRTVRLLRTVSDVNVALVGPMTGPAAAVVKVSRTPAAARSMLRRDQVIGRLAADPRLDGWSELLPTTLGSGSLGAHRYRVEKIMPGCDARVSLRSPDSVGRFLVSAVEAIGGLHRRTGVTTLVDEHLARTLVAEPFEPIRRLLEARPVPDPSVSVLDRWSDEVAASLEGRECWMSWTHGDVCPSNIMIGDDGAVVGVIDWEQGRERDLAVNDVINCLLTTRTTVHRREFGGVVNDALAGRCWSSAERRLVDEARDGLDDHALILLCWARHVAANLEKSPRFGANRLWVQANIDAVLQNR